MNYPLNIKHDIFILICWMCKFWDPCVASGVSDDLESFHTRAKIVFAFLMLVIMAIRMNDLTHKEKHFDFVHTVVAI